MVCTNTVGDIPCNRSFCRSCIDKFFKDDVTILLENKDNWICYCCRGLCRCASCINGGQQQGKVEVPFADQTDSNAVSSPALSPAFYSVKRSSSSETTPVKQPHIAADKSQKQQPTQPEQTEPNLSQSPMPSSSLMQAESSQPSQVEVQQPQRHASQSSKSETTTESSNTNPSRKGSKSSSCDLSVYSNRFMFHCAIYTSVSPSEGVTLNCLSTHKDLEYLKQQNVVPNYKYS